MAIKIRQAERGRVVVSSSTGKARREAAAAALENSDVSELLSRNPADLAAYVRDLSAARRNELLGALVLLCVRNSREIEALHERLGVVWRGNRD